MAIANLSYYLYFMLIQEKIHFQKKPLNKNAKPQRESLSLCVFVVLMVINIIEFSRNQLFLCLFRSSAGYLGYPTK